MKYTHYAPTHPYHTSKTMTLKECVEKAEREVLERAVKTYQTTYEMAEALDSSQATIVRKLKKYKLKICEKE